MAGFTYKSYNFVNKDPMIDQVRTIVQDSHMTYTAIADASGVNRSTISNWLDGNVKKPQAATFNAVLRACGFKLSITPIHAVEVVKSTPQTSVRHVVQMSKFKKTKRSHRG